MTFVAVTYLARVLGVEMFGVVVFAGVVAAYFLLVVDAGLDLVAMREIARQESSVEGIVASVFVLRLGLVAVGMVLLWGFAPWLAPSPAGLAIIFAYSLTLLSFAVHLKWGFQALEQNGLVAAALVLSQMVYLGGVLAYVKGPDDGLKVPLLLFGSELIGAGLLFVQYRRQGFRLWVSLSRRLSWTLLKEAFPLASTRAVRTLSVNFDLLLLGLVGTPSAVGVYSAVSRVILLLREFGELYYLPMFPGLSRAAKEPSGRFAAVAHGGFRYAAIIIFPIAVGGSLTGPELLSFVFGPEYASGSGALSLLLAAMVFVMLTGAYRLGLVAYGQQGTLFGIMAVGAVLNIGMNFILIPRYSIVGGALSALASEALIFLLARMAVAKLVSLSIWGPMIRPALAAGGMAVVLGLLPVWPFLVTVAVGVVSYTVLVFLVGAIRPSELTEAWRLRSLSTVPDKGC
jgi:O-antigen/teichoic acid export membrane protein